MRRLSGAGRLGGRDAVEYEMGGDYVLQLYWHFRIDECADPGWIYKIYAAVFLAGMAGCVVRLYPLCKGNGM